MKKYRLYILVGFLLINVGCKESNKSAEKSKSSLAIIDNLAISRIDSTLKSFIDSGNIAGVSALI